MRQLCLGWQGWGAGASRIWGYGSVPWLSCRLSPLQRGLLALTWGCQSCVWSAPEKVCQAMASEELGAGGSLAAGALEELNFGPGEHDWELDRVATPGPLSLTLAQEQAHCLFFSCPVLGLAWPLYTKHPGATLLHSHSLRIHP